MRNTAVLDHQITVKNLKVWYRTSGDPKDHPVVLLNGWGARLSGLVIASMLQIQNPSRLKRDFKKCY